MLSPVRKTVRHTRRGECMVLAAAFALAGCATTALEPPSPLELLESGPVSLPRDCKPAPGVVYRTAFVVQGDGRVAGIASQSGFGCVQQALEAWVATFRYRPPSDATPAVVDWMAVSAARGG